MPPACISVQGLTERAVDADMPDCTSFFRHALSPNCRAAGSQRDMLDAFKNMTGGKSKLVQKQTDELELLIATAREERSAISAMLTTLTTRSAKLTPLGKSLEQVTEQGDGRDRRGSTRSRSRLAALDDRTQGARGDRQAHPGAEGRRAAGGADDAEGDRPGRRAAEASRSGAAAVVAGAADAGHARDAEEGARDARRAARPAPRRRKPK